MLRDITWMLIDPVIIVDFFLEGLGEGLGWGTKILIMSSRNDAVY